MHCLPPARVVLNPTRPFETLTLRALPDPLATRNAMSLPTITLHASENAAAICAPARRNFREHH
jgi:hypothetical protein